MKCYNKSDVTINNHGILSGRILASTLHNFAGGKLIASLDNHGGHSLSGDNMDSVDSALSYLHTEGIDENQGLIDSIHSSYFTKYYIDNNAVSEAEPYIVAQNVTLELGSIFILKSVNNFNLNYFGETSDVRLLYAQQGEWNIDELSLLTDTKSTLLKVSWSELSDQNNLIATVSFLTPQQAGLSRNGSAATLAAIDAGVFTFESNPEDWVPNINGAMVMGASAGLRHSAGSVQSRINSVRGINSGDELLFTQGLWYEAGYSDAEQDRRNSIDGFNAQTTHLSLGYDVEGDNALLGLAYTHSSTDLHGSNNKQSVDSSDHLFSLYGHYDFNNLFIQGVATYGQGNIDSSRNVGSQLLESDMDSRLYAITSQVGIETKVGNWQVSPMVSVEYDKQHFDSYQESGGSLALNVNSQDYEIFNIGGGASFVKNWSMDWANITPELTAMIYYDVVGDRMQSVSHFVGGQYSFVANGADPDQTSWEVSPSVTIGTVGEYPMNFKLNYTYSGKKDFAANSISGELRFEF